MRFKLGLPQSSKRDNVYDENNDWIDTRSINVIDLGTQDATTILKYELLKINDKACQSGYNEVKKTTTQEPTLYKTRAEAKKARKEKAKMEAMKAMKDKKEHDNSSPDRPKPDE